jgi:hypothetical protein
VSFVAFLISLRLGGSLPPLPTPASTTDTAPESSRGRTLH